MKHFPNFPRYFFAGLLLLEAAGPLMARENAPEDFAIGDAELKLVKIDSDQKESLLGLAADGMGRIFA